MTSARLEALFTSLQSKDLICWGSGKHFRNLTLPFLQNSGLVQNLKGFVRLPGEKMNREPRPLGPLPRFTRQDLATLPTGRTVILISAVGYREILEQIHADPALVGFEAIPSIYLESLYEDLQMLQAPRPPKGFRKHDHPVIPRIIHTFWFSGDPIPEQYQRCLDSWKRYAPDMEVRIWDLNTYHPTNCTYFDQAVARKAWAFASDYARADILRRHGGVYMDLDVEMLRPIDDLLYHDAYMSFESLSRIECGSGMGAAPGNHILEEICKDYESSPYIKPGGTPDISTCPVRYTNIIEKHGLIKNGGFQQVENITIYPFDVLTGKSFDTGIIYSTDDSYTLHHHNGSWVPDPAKAAMETRYREIAEFMENLKS